MGSVDQELLLYNEYQVTENRLLRQQIQGRIRLSDGEWKPLVAIGKQLGKQALDTFLPHHRDPFDRLLIVQAHQEDLTLVTHDLKLSADSVSLLW